MAYLNCPFCPAQACTQGTSDFMLGIGYQRFTCTCKHEFFVNRQDLEDSKKEINERHR